MKTYITLQSPLRHGQRVFNPGDRFGPREYRDMDESILRALLFQRQILELTPENYAIAMQRREHGTIGAGFTHAELVELGILPKDAPAPEAAPTAPTGAIGELEPHGSYFIRPIKRGNFSFFEAVNQAGDLLRAASFKSRDKAAEFIDAMVPA